MVIVLILLTVAALGFLLYRYLCHNKGDYRTTGELAPGEDPDEEYSNKATSEKKEYFIWTLWRLGKKMGSVEVWEDVGLFFFPISVFWGKSATRCTPGLRGKKPFLLWRFYYKKRSGAQAMPKIRFVIVGVNIDGWEAGDRTTGVLRLAALGVKTGGGILKMPRLCDH